MKHLLEIIIENGYEPYRYAITFPDQNASSKLEINRILSNKEKYKAVIFIKGKYTHIYFKDNYSINDFSSMRCGGMAVFFIKNNDFEKPIIWGLYEGDKPPTLITPKLNIEYERIKFYPTLNKEFKEFLNGNNQDSIEMVLKNENHNFIFDNLYTNHLFKYDTTKNPTD